MWKQLKPTHATVILNTEFETYISGVILWQIMNLIRLLTPF